MNAPVPWAGFFAGKRGGPGVSFGTRNVTWTGSYLRILRQLVWRLWAATHCADCFDMAPRATMTLWSTAVTEPRRNAGAAPESCYGSYS
ncbi:MAG: hypothetical protein ACK56I_07115, partial [bacterium]